MTIVLTGLSHHTSPLALRERLMVPAEQLPNVLAMLQAQLGPEAGVAIVSTCNRLEVYVCADEAPQVLHKRITAFLGVINRLAESEFAGFLYHIANTESVQHLFRVAASLDSMVVGENEIMGQVQQAYQVARTAGTLNRTLSVMFQRALKCGKRVRAETAIGAGKVSVASVAVDMAESILKNLSDTTAMIVGSGKVSELSLKSLVEHGVGKVLVLNRTLERASALASRYRGEAIILEALPCHLHRADIVISSTGAADLILRRADFERAIEQRGRAPMFVIDLAVPRDIEHEAMQVDNVYCYDIDDLHGASERNLRKRQNEIDACEAIIRAEIENYLAWQRRLNVEPLISAMTRQFHDLREQELQRVLEKLPDLSENAQKELEAMSRRLVNSFLHKPIAAIKAETTGEHKDALVYLAQQLFGIEEADEQRNEPGKETDNKE